MTWISLVETTLRNKQGSLTKGTVRLNWHAMKATDTRVTDTIREHSSLFLATYVPMELAFAQHHPDVASQEVFFTSCAHLLQQPNVNWPAVEHALTQSLEGLFSKTDFAQFAEPDDMCLFVTAHTHDKPIGIIQFLVTPAYDSGSVKAGLYATNEEVAQLLMKSIFEILPQTSRIFLHTRSTNEDSIARYRSWGFTEFEGPLPYWTDMEYLKTT